MPLSISCTLSLDSVLSATCKVLNKTYMRSSTYGKLDHSVVEEESSRWHLATTPPEGLSWQEANRRVVTGLCDVVNQYDLNFQQLWVRKKKKLGMAAAAAREGKPFWHLERYSWFAHGMMDRVGFIGTVDGASSAVELLGLLAIFVYETIVCEGQTTLRTQTK